MTSRTETEDEAVASSASPAVVLGVLDAESGANDAAMQLALAEARRRGLPIRVVHGCGLGAQLTPETRWSEAERLHAGRRVVGLVARRLRRTCRFQVLIRP